MSSKKPDMDEWIYDSKTTDIRRYYWYMNRNINYEYNEKSEYLIYLDNPELNTLKNNNLVELLKANYIKDLMDPSNWMIGLKNDKKKFINYILNKSITLDIFFVDVNDKYNLIYPDQTLNDLKKFINMLEVKYNLVLKTHHTWEIYQIKNSLDYYLCFVPFRMFFYINTKDTSISTKFLRFMLLQKLLKKLLDKYKSIVYNINETISDINIDIKALSTLDNSILKLLHGQEFEFISDELDDPNNKSRVYFEDNLQTENINI